MDASSKMSPRKLSQVVRTGILYLFIFSAIAGWQSCATLAMPPCEIPAWTGTMISDCEDAGAWTIETGGGSTGNLTTVAGLVDQAVRLEYKLGTLSGPYIQARHNFSPPIDLSTLNLLGISVRGASAPAGTTNRIRLMVADTSGVFFGCDLGEIAQLDRWMINMPVPKALLTHQSWSTPGPIAWNQIDRFFVVVEPPDNTSARITSGSLTFDHILGANASLWTPPPVFESTVPDATAAADAVQCILDAQCATGLFQSWIEEPEATSWLYDQALALIVLVREHHWSEAEALVSFLLNEQNADGHWPRQWDCTTGTALTDDAWVGDQAWMAYALHLYAAKRCDTTAAASAQLAGDWIISRMDGDGIVITSPPSQRSTEGNFDAWMALTQLGRTTEADQIAVHLLTTFWDDELHYWRRGYQDERVALNANAWIAAGFAMHARVNRPDLALAAEGFIRRTLATRSTDGTICGLDFEGPVSVHCEGLGSYVVARGPDAQQYLNILNGMQRPSGCSPGATDNWYANGWWGTTWSGIAPTAWLYFANTTSPFAVGLQGDLNCDRTIDTDDVMPFILALIDPPAYEASYPSCLRDKADMNCDDSLDGRDIDDFIMLLLNG